MAIEIRARIVRDRNTVEVPLWPGAENTGHSGTLTDRASFLYVTEPNTVVENLNLQLGMATANSATNCTVRNCIVDGSAGFWGIDSGATGLLVEDCTMLGGATTNACIGDAPGGNGVFRRLDISGSQDGVKISSGSTIEDCWIHDLAPYDPIGDTHNDGIQMQDYANITIRRNKIIMGAGSTSAILMGGGEARPPITNVLIEQNLLAGGVWTLYGPAGANNPPGASSDVRIINNHFSTVTYANSGSAGPVTAWEAGVGNVYSGNVWEDGVNVGQTVSS